jgi:hypothetical protein
LQTIVPDHDIFQAQCEGLGRESADWQVAGGKIFFLCRCFCNRWSTDFFFSLSSPQGPHGFSTAGKTFSLLAGLVSELRWSDRGCRNPRDDSYRKPITQREYHKNSRTPVLYAALYPCSEYQLRSRSNCLHVLANPLQVLRTGFPLQRRISDELDGLATTHALGVQMPS